MKINHNITAQIANVNLKKDERKIGSVLQKLSSGYKIIHQSVFFNEFMDFNDKMKRSKGIKYLEMICLVFK